MSDHYSTLGVPRSATADEVRKAYLRLARDRHPDRFVDAAEKAKAQDFFQAVTEAFNTLSNERVRREYDAELSRPRLETPEEIAKDAYARGLKRAEERDYTAAIELLKVASHHVPGEAQYQIALARAYARNPGFMREALASFEKALQLSPGNAGYHFELATLLSAQGLKLRARKAVEAARKLAPDDAAITNLALELGASEVAADKEKEKAAAGKSGGLRGLFSRKG